MAKIPSSIFNPLNCVIADVLTQSHAELAALEQRQSKTPALKQGMMQELLTRQLLLI